MDNCPLDMQVQVMLPDQVVRNVLSRKVLRSSSFYEKLEVHTKWFKLLKDGDFAVTMGVDRARVL